MSAPAAPPAATPAAGPPGASPGTHPGAHPGASPGASTGAHPDASWAGPLRAAAVLLPAVALWLWLFRAEAAAALRVWQDSTAYNHCFLVLPLALWLGWERRARLRGRAAAPEPWLLALALPAGLAWLAAQRLGIMEGRQLAAMALLEALFLAVLGRALFRAMAAPLLFLLFLVPSGAFLTPALQGFTASFIVAGLSALGIPHSADGMVVAIPEGVFLVAQACAGLRFLVACVAFGVLYALTLFRSPGRRLGFVALCAVVPVLANGVRALGIVVLGHLLGSAEAGATDHILYGWLFFSLVVGALVLLGLPWREDHLPDHPLPPDAPAGTAPGMTVGMAIGMAGRPVPGARPGVPVHATPPGAPSVPIRAMPPVLPPAPARAPSRGRPALALPVAAGWLLLAASGPAVATLLRGDPHLAALPPGWLPPGCTRPADTGSGDAKPGEAPPGRAPADRPARFLCGPGVELLVQRAPPGEDPGRLPAVARRLTGQDAAEDVQVSALRAPDGQALPPWQLVRVTGPDAVSATALWVGGAPARSGLSARARQAWSTLAGRDDPAVLAVLRAQGPAAGSATPALLAGAVQDPALDRALARLSEPPPRAVTHRNDGPR